jgi:hypothetical protein
MQTMTGVARSLMPADDLPDFWLTRTVEDTLAWRFFIEIKRLSHRER